MLAAQQQSYTKISSQRDEKKLIGHILCKTTYLLIYGSFYFLSAPYKKNHNHNNNNRCVCVCAHGFFPQDSPIHTRFLFRFCANRFFHFLIVYRLICLDFPTGILPKCENHQLNDNEKKRIRLENGSHKKAFFADAFYIGPKDAMKNENNQCNSHCLLFLLLLFFPCACIVLNDWFLSG